MPFGAAGLATTLGGSLVSGSKGSKGANKASNAILQQLSQAIGDTASTTQGGQKIIGSATNAGEGRIAGGVGGGLQALNQGLGSANSLLAPYQALGASATGGLQQLTNSASSPLNQTFSFNPSNLAQDPGYAFTLQQGQQALQRSAAAQGNLFSGGTLKSLANYTTGTANQYFNDAFQRAQSTFNTNTQTALQKGGVLNQLANLGYGATGQGVNANLGTGGAAANLLYGGGVTGAQLGLQGNEANAQLGEQGQTIIDQLMAQAGQAKAGGIIGGTNSWLNALQQGTNGLSSYFAFNNPFGGGNPDLVGNTGSIPLPDAGTMGGGG